MLSFGGNYDIFMRLQLIILVCILLGFSLSGSAMLLDHDSLLYIIEEHEDDSIEAKALLNLAMDISKEYPDSAFLYLEDAGLIASELRNNHLLARVHMEKGLIFENMNELADALENYYEVKKLIESDEDFKQDSTMMKGYLRLLNQMGILYFTINKFENALQYLHEIPDIIDSYEGEMDKDFFRNTYLKAYINIGAVSIRVKKYNEAEINFTKALSFLDDDDLISYAVILNNLGIVAKEKQEYDKAFDYHQRALSIREEAENQLGMAQSYNNIAATYFASGDKNKAGIYFNKALEISHKESLLTSAVMALDYLMQISEARNEYKKAFDYQAELTEYNDSLFNQEKMRTIAQLEMQDKFDMRLRESKFKQEKIDAEQKRKEMVYILLTAASLLGILILFLIYSLQRSKMRRHALESNKNALEVKSLELEKINLERELEFRNKELATNVMYMARTSEFITHISEKLLKSKMYFTKDNQEVIKKIISELQTYIDQDTWTEFEVRFQQVHNEFYTKINELHPDLTANEKKLCAFLRLNMTTKEISAITYQSVNSIIVARSRLRKKLGIERDENLVSYLESL